jgi:molybdopterin molybdotransferase
MLSVAEYLDLVLDSVSELPPMELPISDANGCVLAEDIYARWPLPSFDNSSMDGYAVIASDLVGASESAPIALPVIDDIPAGFKSLETLRSGQAIRIMTGAPMPAGADSVIPVESTDGGSDVVVILASIEVGSCIRREGEDVQAGDLVLTKGTFIGPRQIALIAAVGHGVISVIPKPRVAVVATGSELVEPGTELKFGLISDSNSFLITAIANDSGAVAYRLPPAQDDEDTLIEILQDQVHRADLIITTGGVSMGAYDPVKSAFLKLGTAQFHKVAMQPGMPQGFGSVGDPAIPIITLPGNPVSAYVSFEVFIRPAIRKMRGLKQLQRPERPAVVKGQLRSPMNKVQFARGRFMTDGQVELVGAGQGSHVLGGLAQADALIVIPVGVDSIASGEQVRVIDVRGVLF